MRVILATRLYNIHSTAKPYHFVNLNLLIGAVSVQLTERKPIIRWSSCTCSQIVPKHFVTKRMRSQEESTYLLDHEKLSAPLPVFQQTNKSHSWFCDPATLTVFLSPFKARKRVEAERWPCAQLVCRRHRAGCSRPGRRGPVSRAL